MWHMIEDTQQMTGDFFQKIMILFVPYKGFFKNILYQQEQGKQILITNTEKIFFYWVFIHGLKIILQVS